MNKIFSKTLVALSAIFALTLSSCTEEYEYDANSAYVSGEQVYFGNDMATTIETPVTQNSFNVSLSRANATGALTVPVTISTEEGCIYHCDAQQVTFAPGQSTANLTFTYNPEEVVYGTYYDITIALAGAAGTPYGLSTYTFKAGMTEWVKMNGKGIFRDDLLASIFGTPNYTWEVDIEESVVTPGRYRVIAPYSPNTDFRKADFWDNENEILDYFKPADNDVIDMVIDATDPEHVYFEPFESGLSGLGGAGKISFTMYVDVWMEDGTDLETIIANRPTWFGKLDKGVISFAAADSKALLWANDGELWNYVNNSKMLAIALPGYSLKDYTAELTYAGIFTNPGGEVFAMANLTLGNDATNVKAIVMEEDADAGAVADAIAAGDLEAYDVEAGTISVPVGDLTGKLQLIVAVIDEGIAQTVATVGFEHFSGASPWKSLGIGYWVDDLIVPLFTEEGQSYTYEVRIEENNETPGLYRVRNAYAPVAEAFGEEGGNMDIEIHAEKANGVYIMQQPIGLNFGYGDMSIMTDAGYLVERNGFNDTYSKMPDIFGTVTDGIINFPILEEENNSGDIVNYQAWIAMGGSYYFGGVNGEFQILLPGAAPADKARAKKMAQATKFAMLINNSYGLSRGQHARRLMKDVTLFRAKDLQ